MMQRATSARTHLADPQGQGNVQGLRLRRPLDEVLVGLAGEGHPADGLLEAHAGAARELLIYESKVAVQLVDGGAADVDADLVPEGEADRVHVVRAGVLGVHDRAAVADLGSLEGREGDLQRDARDQVAVPVQGAAGGGVEAGGAELLQLVIERARGEAHVHRPPQGVGCITIDDRVCR